MSDTLDRLQAALRFVRQLTRLEDGEAATFDRHAFNEIADALACGIEALGGTVEEEPDAVDMLAWVQGYLLGRKGKPASREDLADVVEALAAFEDEFGGGIVFRPEIDNEE